MNESIEKRIDDVLEKIRPFLAREGGDIKLDHFDSKTGICYVDMIGACSGCVMATSDVSDTISLMVMDEVPEVVRVELIQPEKTSVENSFDALMERLKREEEEYDKLEEEKKDDIKKEDTSKDE